MVIDQAIMEGWFEDNERYEREIRDYRFRTLIYGLPAIGLLALTVLSVRKKNDQLFYWTFLTGLTLLQIIPVAGLINENENEPSFIEPILILIVTLLFLGQLFSAFKIVRIRKHWTEKKKEKTSHNSG